jgi:HWE histidine kinase/PAS domain-containing protein
MLHRVRRGARVDHYETIRRRKDGSLVDVSLTVSPIKDGRGKIVGASKIAQDITERKHADDLRALMADELNHRVKNTLATVQSIAAQSLKGAMDGQGREAFDARLVALSRTHYLLARDNWEGASLRELCSRSSSLTGPRRAYVSWSRVLILGSDRRQLSRLAWPFMNSPPTRRSMGLCQPRKDRFALRGTF